MVNNYKTTESNNRITSNNMYCRDIHLWIEHDVKWSLFTCIALSIVLNPTCYTLCVCVHKCVLQWATAADGVKRYRLQLHLLWLPYELKKKSLKKKIIDAQLPYEYTIIQQSHGIIVTLLVLGAFRTLCV